MATRKEALRFGLCPNHANEPSGLKSNPPGFNEVHFLVLGLAAALRPFRVTPESGRHSGHVSPWVLGAGSSS